MPPLPAAIPVVTSPAPGVIALVAQAAAPPAAGGQAEQFFPWVTLPLILLLGWFMVLRPERERQRKQDQLIAGLKKNDRVLTTGGFYGTVANVDRDGQRVVLKIDDTGSAKITVTLSSIARVLDPSTESGSPSGD
jgi:preprotein translocase subunit YajC